MPMLNEGDLAPEFSLRNHQHALVSLAQMRGHHVLLWWYPKADTPG